MKKQQVNPRWNHFPESYFGRTVDDILEGGFFNSMDANIRESVKTYEMEIAVPGMTRKDLQIIVRNGVLQVKGERDQTQRPGWGRNHIEFSSRAYQRSFILPPDANTRRIKARCRNGLLQVVIPKQKLANQQHIDVPVGLQPGFNRPKRSTSLIGRIGGWVTRLFA